MNSAMETFICKICGEPIVDLTTCFISIPQHGHAPIYTCRKCQTQKHTELVVTSSKAMEPKSLIIGDWAEVSTEVKPTALTKAADRVISEARVLLTSDINTISQRAEMLRVVLGEYDKLKQEIKERNQSDANC